MKSSKKLLLIFSYWSILVKPETKTHLKNSIMMMQRLNSWSSTCVTAALTPCSAVVALHLRTPFDTYLHRHPASESKKKALISFRNRSKSEFTAWRSLNQDDEETTCPSIFSCWLCQASVCLSKMIHRHLSLLFFVLLL